VQKELAVIDTLSDVLGSVRLADAVFFEIEASAPWAAAAPPGRVLFPHLGPAVEHVVAYHVVTRGSCWCALPGQPALELEAGDVIVFPHGDPHTISSAPGVPPGLELRAPQARRAAPPVPISIQAGDSHPTHVVCGFLGCDARPFEPLLQTLPRVLHRRGGGNLDSAERRLVELAVSESASNRAGASCVLARLGELLFVEVVRKYVAELPTTHGGLLAGLRDEGVGRALQKLHARPAHPCSLEQLAREVGMSRSSLAQHFASFVGIPPIQYLAEWRLQLAASLLRGSKSSLAEIADRVGYGSEAALSRAFKRQFGVAPTPYRRAEP
jgi:AraC-like DNA-binding protein